MTPVDPFLMPVITPADTEGVAKIIGGVGGIRFQWEELDRGAQIVSDAAAELRRIWISTNWIGMQLSAVRTISDVLAAGISTGAGIAAADGINVGLERLSESGSTLEETADKIRKSRLTYELAEFNARDHISHVVAEFLPWAPYISRPLTLEQTKTDSVDLEGTVDGLLSRVSHATDEAGSSFEVLEVDGETGRTYVVVIPGTEGDGFGVPFSEVGIAEAKIEDSKYVNGAVAGALAQVGAEPGANVTLVGYSQGGMHAVNLANSGPVSEKYSVDLVVTAGSPIAEEDTPDKTTFLHISHEEDGIPALNLIPITDRPNQVSVVLDHPVKQAEGWKDRYGGPAHEISSYRQGARAVDLSSHPSIAPITAALGAAVVGSTARRHVFQVTRPPLIGPQPAPTNTAPSELKVKEGLAPGSGDRSRDK